MPNRCKPTSEKRNKGLMLSLRQREYEIIEALSKKLGVSKVDLVLSAIKKQYSKSAINNDNTNNYIALLKEQIKEYEDRIKKEQEVLKNLKDEYEYIVDLTTKGESDETNEDI